MQMECMLAEAGKLGAVVRREADILRLCARSGVLVESDQCHGMRHSDVNARAVTPWLF